MTESDLDKFSPKELIVARQILDDVMEVNKNLPAGLMADMLGDVAVTLNKKRTLVLPGNYSPEQINVAIAVAETYLQGRNDGVIDENTDEDIFFGADELREALEAHRHAALDRPSHLPQISIEKLKFIVQAELRGIGNFESRITEDVEARPEVKALQNLEIVQSWMENTHLQEYLGRKDIVFSLFKYRRTDALPNIGIGGIGGSVLGGVISLFYDLSIYTTYPTTVDTPSLLLANGIAVVVIGGIGLLSGGIMGALEAESKSLRVQLTGKGLVHEHRLFNKEEILDEQAVMKLWDAGDRQKIVRDLGNLDKAKVVSDLNKFIEKH